ncbi:MAG: RNA 2',3'-cyclic phosphodiesterase [Marinobacter sp.]|nr:RNA 2',3'-cyclic phosphodiesterase [Marinobacter sp.]
MRRLFFGLDLPADIKQRLLGVNAPISGAKWQSLEQLHITLLFLGNVKQDRIAALCDAARNLPVEAFELDVTGLGCFGQPRSPRNLWAGVQPPDPVAALHGALRSRMATLGFAPESRSFRPHITLARFKKQRGSVEGVLDDHGDSAFGHFAVSDVVLFESNQGRGGSIYTVIERFPLPVALIDFP